MRGGNDIRSNYDEFVRRNGVRSGVEKGDQRMKCGRRSESGYPVASPLPHVMCMVSHWAVVGFGSAMVGSFQLK